MLPKISKPYLHKLRIVQLFEGVNAELKIIYSRRLIKHTETHLLNPDQIYAGPKGWTVHDCLVNLQTTYEISMVMREVVGIIFNDMAGCYIRLHLNLNTITAWRLVMDKNAVLTHAQTITGMSPIVWATFGDSSANITASVYFGGTGQDSRASPTACHIQLLVMLFTLQ